MSTGKVNELLADALGLAPSDVLESTAFETCPSWDSLAHFRVIAALEEALDRPLSPTEIFDVTDYKSVEALLASP